MALFSRRNKDSAPASEAEAPSEAVEPDETTPEAPVEDVPHVPISVTTFGRPAPARTSAPAPAQAPEITDGGAPVPPDNGPLVAALSVLSAQPSNLEVLNVMRQGLQGLLYVRAQGDAKAQADAGQQLTLATIVHDGKRFLLAFSGAAAMRASMAANAEAGSTAVAQPAIAIYRTVVTGDVYEGIMLDHASEGARVILPTELIKRALESADPEFTIKSLLSGPRTESTAAEVAQALGRVPFWVAGNAKEDGQIGLAEARNADGERRLEIYTHPLEVISMGRDDRPLPLTGVQLGRALGSDEGIAGVVIDAKGPWMTLDRADLAPLVALAAAADADGVTDGVDADPDAE